MLNECAFTENEVQHNQCLIRKAHKETIFKELTALGGQRVNQDIKDSSAYLAALKRHRKEQALDDEKCAFPNCDPDGFVKRIALKMKKAPETYPEDSNRIWFNVTTLTQYSFEEAAVLYYVGRIKTQYPNKKFKSRFYYYTSPADVAEYTVLSTGRELDNITGLMAEDTNWESFDITALARNWIENPEKNFGIMIKLIVEDDDGNEEYGEMVASTKPSAYLEISNTRFRIKEKRNSVVRYKTPLCDSSQNHKNTSCCLFPFTLSFDDFNWDWIISPKRINFWYCAGYCTVANLKSTSHSQVLFNNKNSMAMCCAPEVSEPIDILYQDSAGTLQLKTIPHMIVRSCSCS
uniref:TGF-beta family profile domain-containing protein n=1 Tax=Panagrolaimus sp. ES5 TaxID=591445 RepID=A0AC34GSY5_9BILA